MSVRVRRVTPDPSRWGGGDRSSIYVSDGPEPDGFSEGRFCLFSKIDHQFKIQNIGGAGLENGALLRGLEGHARGPLARSNGQGILFRCPIFMHLFLRIAHN